MSKYSRSGGLNSSQLGTNELQKSSGSIPRRDQKGVLVSRLKNINYKLRQHLKELNLKLEIAIDKSQTVKKKKLPVKAKNIEEETEKVQERINRVKREIERLKAMMSQEHTEDELE